MRRATASDAGRAPRERQAAPAVGETAPARWVVAAIVALTVLLGYVGVTTGEWRGVLVSEIQVLAVGLVTYWGLR